MPSAQPSERICNATQLTFEENPKMLGMLFDQGTYYYTHGMVVNVSKVGEGGFAPNGMAYNIKVPDSEEDYGLTVGSLNATKEVVSNPNGGEITFYFIKPVDEIMSISLCGLSGTVASGGGLIITLEDGTVVSMLDAFDGMKAGCDSLMIENAKDAVNMTVFFKGEGIITSVGICIDPDTPNITNNFPPLPTPSPTRAPTSAPTESLAPTVCPPAQAELVDHVGGTIFEDGSNLIQIVSANKTHVEFTVKNTFKYKFTNVYTEYHAGSFGETECLENTNINTTETVGTYTAVCMHNVPISIVHVWVASTEFDLVLDNAEVPECCNPTSASQTPKIQMTFKLPCIDPCPEDAEPVARRLDRTVETASAKDFERETKEFVSASSTNLEPSIDGKDGHFCVGEDYPCGDDDDRVYVCHYSARDGYKTFCVPEADSDVLAFYPKDYCGPCVGGYGGNVKEAF
jgi:hypothetical protein